MTLTHLSPALLVSLSVAVAHAQFQPDEHTLFLAHFDESTEADFAKGKPTATGEGEITVGQEGRFGEAVRLSPRSSLAYAGPENIDPSQGTLELWFCLETDPFEPYRLFNFNSSDHNYLNLNQIPDCRLGAALCGGPDDDWVYKRLDYVVRDWERGQWHHLAATWGDDKFAWYVDGEPAAPTATGAKMPLTVPETFTFLGFAGMIDEVRISSVVRTPEEIRAAAANPGGAKTVVPLTFLTDHAPLPDEHGPGMVWRDKRVVHDELPLPIAMGGQLFRRGVALAEGTSATYPVPEGHDRLVTTVGLSEWATAGGEAVFRVLGDGKELHKTAPLGKQSPPQRLTIDLGSAEHVTLSASMVGDSPTPRATWADWGELILLKPEEPIPPPRSRPVLQWQRTVAELKLQAYDLDFSLSGRPSGYGVVPWNYLDDFDPSCKPRDWPQPVRLETFATPGEYEPLSFVVYAQQRLRNVAVETTDLVGPAETIPKSAVDLRWVMRCPHRTLYTRKAEESELVSRFLLSKPVVDLGSQSFRQVHATLHVPDEAKPGKYEGTWTVRPAGAPPTEIAVSLEVLPFKLGEPADRRFGMYYRFGAFPDDVDRMERELTDLREHGATTLIPNLQVGYEKDGDAIVPDFSDVTNGLELMHKHGFHGPVTIGTGFPALARLLGVGPDKDNPPDKQQRFEQVGKRALEGLVKLNKQFPEFELVATHMDEVMGRDRLARYLYLTNVVRLVPDLRMYITMHNSPREGIAEMTKEIDPFVDLRCYNGHALDDWLRAGHTFEELAAQLEASGDEAWTYYNIRGSFFLPEWTRLVNSYYLWMSPLKAHVPWMYYHVQANPLDDTDGPRARGHDFGYAVPSPDDPLTLIPTRHWEAYREGIDDLRYLALLERLLAEAKDKAPDAAKTAQAWLDELRSHLPKLPDDIADIEGESPVLIWFSQKYTGDDYQRWRRRTAEEIVKLQAAGK